jgi:hypothetical protein
VSGRLPALWLSLLAVGLATGGGLAGPAHGATAPVVATVRFAVQPALAGVPFVHHGRRYVTNAGGNVFVPATAAELAHGGAPLRAALRVGFATLAPDMRARFSRWVGRTAVLVVLRPVRPVLVDPAGKRIDVGVAPQVVVRGSDGSRLSLPNGQVSWLASQRPILRPGGQWRTRRVSYTVQAVRAHGANVVHRDQQRFAPAEQEQVNVRTLFFSMRLTVRDALFGHALGHGLVLRFPDGHAERYDLPRDAQRTITGLPRGDYSILADAPGISFARPVSLSKSQEVDLKVIGWLDVAVVGSALAALAVGLAVARRPSLRRPLRALRAVVAGGRRRG